MFDPFTGSLFVLHYNRPDELEQGHCSFRPYRSSNSIMMMNSDIFVIVISIMEDKVCTLCLLVNSYLKSCSPIVS